VLIDSVTKGDSDKQAVVTFKQEYPWWEGLFNYVLPPQVKDADTFNTAYLKKLNPEWGAGPYKVDRADFNTGEVSFVKNEKWWGDEGELDKITYRYLEDQASLNAFQAGELDATRVATKARFATASNMGDKGGYPHRTASLQLPGHPQRQVPAAGGCGGP
jgi:peptide/nickel transport system substrate-binding protein